MRVLIAPQELKGTLTAVEAAEAMAAGLRAAFPDWEFDLLPMADGGPGTTAALLAALGGSPRVTTVADPLLRPVDAEWGILDNGLAVIECAAASGLWRLQTAELNPLVASSRGTGELIAAALREGCTEVLIGLGGSATNDGGAGLAQALGFHLLDAEGRELGPGGAALAALERIERGPQTEMLAGVKFAGATDVTNPLCGPQGASAVYGPQKGATPALVAQLDAALGRLADVIARDLGKEVRNKPGAGAAGGLGAALLAFLGADLRSGAELVGEAAGIEERIARAGLVLTGEGRLDGQSAYGKTTQYVARLGKALRRPVACVAGQFGPGYERLAGSFAGWEALSDGKKPLPSKDEARQQLAQATSTLVSRLIESGAVDAT